MQDRSEDTLGQNLTVQDRSEDTLRENLTVDLPTPSARSRRIPAKLSSVVFLIKFNPRNFSSSSVSDQVTVVNKINKLVNNWKVCRVESMSFIFIVKSPLMPTTHSRKSSQI